MTLDELKASIAAAEQEDDEDDSEEFDEVDLTNALSLLVDCQKLMGDLLDSKSKTKISYKQFEKLIDLEAEINVFLKPFDWRTDV